MSEQSFNECITASVPPSGLDVDALLLSSLPGAVDVRRANSSEDKSGTDYFVTLRRGAVVNIDLKIRRKGCSRFWSSGPELALEKWSVTPDDGAGKTGWTLSESSTTHYTLHAFDSSDASFAYILPFQLLRKAFRKRLIDWSGRYGERIQFSSNGKNKWRSSSIFVPASIVVGAISEEMICSSQP